MTLALTLQVRDRRTEPDCVAEQSAPLSFQRPDGRVMLAIAGPHPVPLEALAQWLADGCPDPAPVRQGFAAILVDPRIGSSTLAVGARSEVALYWSHSRGGFTASSHVPTLLQRLPVAPELDIDKLARILQFHDDPATTVFRGVHRLPAGYVATWTPGTDPWVRRWFNPFEVEPHDSRRDGDGVDVLRRVISEAVELSLPPAGNVAAHLSGGLDSTTVTALAAHNLHPQGRVVHTLSHVAAPGEWPEWLPAASDDEPAIRAMGDYVAGLDQHFIVHDGTDPIADFRWFFDHAGYPFLNPSNLPWLRRMDRWAHEHGAEVMLTGAKGSIGYSSTRIGQYRRALRHGQMGLIARDLHLRRDGGDSLMLLAHDVVHDLSPSTARRWKRLRHGPPGMGRELVPLSPAYALQGRSESMPTGRDAWRNAVLFDPSAATSLAPPAFNVWHSDPLGDAEVTRVLFALGPQAWLGDGRDRGLARRVTAGLLPDEVRLRTVRGVQGYDLPRAIANHQREYAEALELVEASPTAQALLNLPAIRASMADGVPTEGRDAYSWQLFQGRALGMGLFIAWYEDHAARRDGSLA